MRRSLTILFALTLGLLSSLANAQQQQRVETALDRTEITRGETVTLRVRVHGQQGGVQIELDPLREHFEIVSTRSASHLRSVNNRIESWTDYNLVLFPRGLGEQQIPPLSVAGQETTPYTINVLEPSGEGLGGGQEVYMETVLNKESVYVQEQLLFTIRLYYTIAGIRNPNFTEVEPEGAVVQLLGQPHQYEQLIDGIRYGVYEKNYIIFPQRSGEIVIPDIVFRGELTDGSSNFVFRNPNMRPVTAFANGYTIEVKERPAAFPAGRTWLPAQDLVVTENWSRDITTLEAGDSVRRTITVVAVGLDGAALPPLGRPEIDRMNVYPDAPVIERRVVDGNIVGSRVETYEMVATGEGSVVIPEITLPWWDIEADQQREAVLPTAFIRVAPQGGFVQPDPGSEDATLPGDNLNLLDAGDSLISPAATPGWVLNTMMLSIVLLLGVMGWMWRRRLQLMQQQSQSQVSATPSVSVAYARSIAAGQEEQAFNDLKQSIQKDDAQKVRLRLIDWGRQYFADPGLYNLDDLSARLDDTALRDSLKGVQAALYADPQAATHFGQTQREELLQRLSAARGDRARHDQQERRQQPYRLPPLYRN